MPQVICWVLCARYNKLCCYVMQLPYATVAEIFVHQVPCFLSKMTSLNFALYQKIDCNTQTQLLLKINLRRNWIVRLKDIDEKGTLWKTWISNTLCGNATVKLSALLNEPSQKRVSKGHGSLVKAEKIKWKQTYDMNWKFEPVHSYQQI